MNTLEQQLQEAVDCYEQDNTDDRTKVYKQAMKDFLGIANEYYEGSSSFEEKEDDRKWREKATFILPKVRNKDDKVKVNCFYKY